MKKLKIGVSACLIGLKYRYDGSSRMDAELIRLLGDKVDFIPVCPEWECGLSIPRPPMRLVLSPKGTRLRECESGADHTDELLAWAEEKLEQLDRRDIAAFLFKSKSPSCGCGSAKLFAPSGRCIRENGSGIFAKVLTTRFPNMIVGEEIALKEFAGKLGLL